MFSTCSRVAGATLSGTLKTRDTVATDTPASRATSRMLMAVWCNTFDVNVYIATADRDMRMTLHAARATGATKQTARTRRAVARLARGMPVASALAPHAKQLIQNETRCPQRDGRVRHVERRKAPAANMEVQKVHDIAVHQPVHHIAHRAAQMAPGREAEEVLPGVGTQLPHDEERGCHADAGEQPPLPAPRVRQERKRSAQVA